MVVNDDSAGKLNLEGEGDFFRRECSMAIPGTDFLEVPTIYKAYVRAI